MYRPGALEMREEVREIIHDMRGRAQVIVNLTALGPSGLARIESQVAHLTALLDRLQRALGNHNGE